LPSSSENKLFNVPDDSAPLVLLPPLDVEAPPVDALAVDADAVELPERLNRLDEPVWFDDVYCCSNDSRPSALDAPVIAGNMTYTP
jgi:hypothetical protein